MSAPGQPGRWRFDLHVHSDRSDGRLPPEEVLRRAAVGGLDVLALTDHDSAPVLPHGPCRVAGRTVHVLHAAEVSGMHEGQELHLLVYFRGEMPPAFRGLCKSLSMARATRYREAAAALGHAELAPPSDEACAGERAVTRVHLSEALVAAGHARNLSDAFARFTGSRLGMVPPVPLSFLAAIRLARAAGGLCSWAHPGDEQARAWTGTFAAEGLHALEASRPGLSPMAKNSLLRLAHRHGLRITGGSDFHGFEGQRALGSWSFPAREARPFARALGLPV